MFWNKPKPRELRVADLEEAQRELHEHRKNLEYYAATTGMYEVRVARLQEEIAADPAPVPVPRPIWSLWQVPASVHRKALEEKNHG